MALQEIFLLVLAARGGVETVVEAVFQLPHEEVAGIGFAVDSDLWVGHVILWMSCRAAGQTKSFGLAAGREELVVGPGVPVFEDGLLIVGETGLDGCALHIILQLLHLEAVVVVLVDTLETGCPSLHVLIEDRGYLL